MRFIRVVSFEVFGTVQALIILSLIMAPIPIGMAAGGFTDKMIAWSVLIGCLYALESSVAALTHLISFRVHLVITALVGIGLFLAGLLAIPARYETPHLLMMIYGSILFVASLITKHPESRAEELQESDVESGPASIPRSAA